MLPISALKILLLVKRFIQISVDVNKPFAIKCCAMTQTEALLYIYWLLITNTLFVEQILPKSTSLPEYLATFSLCGGDFRKRKGSSFTDMQIIYRMNLGDFRHRCTMKLKVYINRHENGRKSWKGVNNMWMNFSPTCCQKPECQCSTTIYCQHNSIFHRQKKLLFVFLTGLNWGLSGLKNMWPVIMTGDLLSVILNIVRWN